MRCCCLHAGLDASHGGLLERPEVVLSGISQVPSVLQTTLVSKYLDVHDVNLEDEY